jgi:hypothetical protein
LATATFTLDTWTLMFGVRGVFSQQGGEGGGGAGGGVQQGGVGGGVQQTGGVGGAQHWASALSGTAPPIRSKARPRNRPNRVERVFMAGPSKACDGARPSNWSAQ